MKQRICDHCGHPSHDGWGELRFIYMGKEVVIDVCPNDVPEARRLLKDFAVFNPDLFRGQAREDDEEPPKKGRR